ncbi:MAG: aminotransferase class I/II-fold pyridoxal phosphate-dependent enzyme [Pseudomonadota bacterium]
MEQNVIGGHNRRSFLAGAGVGAGVFALGPLAASVAAGSEAQAASESGNYAFDKPYNRIGFDDVKWDGAMRTEHVNHLVAGLGVADMDFECAPSITAALAKRIQHHNWGYVDMDEPGPMAFKQGLIDWNEKRYGIKVINHQNLGITTGVHAGLLACLRAYTRPGDKVLLATPIYNGFYGDIQNSRTVKNESLMHWINGRYEIDWNDFEKKASIPGTKVSILCNPQNPVGRVWSKDELTRYGEICLKHNVLVLSDEIHCDFVTKGQKYTPFANLDDRKVVANSITFKSGSKSFSLSGQMCAWYYSTNPEVFARTSFENHPDLNVLGMIAEQAAYSGGEEWLNQLVNYIDGNLDFAHNYVKTNIPMIKVGNKPEGTYLMWADVSDVIDKIGAKKSADAANRSTAREQGKAKLGTDYAGNQAMIAREMITPSLVAQHWFAKNAYVKLNAGSTYGLGGENYMRINCATARSTLKAGLDSMANALKKISA